MNLPYYLLKSLTQMANKIQTHPKNAQCILIHKGIIKVLFIQELNRIQTPWEQFLVESGFEKHRIPKTIFVAKTKAPKKTNSSKNRLKMAQMDVSSITRQTRLIKAKLILHEQDTSRQELVSATKREKYLECKRVYTRKRARKVTIKTISHSRENITEPVEENARRQMEEPSYTIQNKKGNKRTQQKGKREKLVGTSRRVKT
jgi:hypothetical protein